MTMMKTTSKLTIMLWFTLMSGVVGAIEFTDCDSEYNIDSVEISGCSTAPCYMILNTTVTVATHFTPASDATSLTNDVYFSLNNARINATVRPDPCASFVCPLSATQHQTYTYTSEVNVPVTLPALGGELVWSLKDEHDKKVICFKVDIQLTPSKASSSSSASGSQQQGAAAISVSSPAIPQANTTSTTGQSSTQNGSPGGQFCPPGGSSNPPGGQQYPSGGQQYPSGGQQSPSGGQQYPSGGQQYPSGDQQSPSGGQQYPSGGQQYPSGGQQSPSGGQQYPSGGQQSPGGQQHPSGSGGQPGPSGDQHNYPGSQS